MERRRVEELFSPAPEKGRIAHDVIRECIAGTQYGNGACVGDNTNPSPEYVGSSCDIFNACGPDNSCGCYATAWGGGFCAVTSRCSELTRCFNGQSDCPAGTVCVVGLCCQEPVCKPLETMCMETEAPAATFAAADGPTTASR